MTDVDDDDGTSKLNHSLYIYIRQNKTQKNPEQNRIIVVDRIPFENNNNV